MMNRILFSFLTGLLLYVQPAPAQSLDQILSRHFTALGQDILSKAINVRSSGKAIQLDMELPFIQIQERPGKMYLEIDIEGMKMIQACDGITGWSVEPWISQEPRVLSGPELTNLELMAMIDSDLVNWKEKGYLLEYTGKETIENSDIFILKMTKGSGDIYQFFLDSETYLLKKIVTITDYNGNVVEGETILDDYRKVNGISVPFRTEVRYGGQTLMTNFIENVEFNVVIDDRFFSKP